LKKGLKEDMLIFEPNLSKKYPKFSGGYVDLHFKSNPANDNNDEFLYTYDKIVKPSRWSRVYKGIRESYDAGTRE